MLTDSELFKAYEGRQVLVTGGAGFIGSHLVEALVQANARVRVLDDLSTGDQANLADVEDRVELAIGDICDLAVCQRAAEGVEIVFHEAALVSVPESIRVPKRAYEINVVGTSNVFEAASASGAQRVVYASSSAVYGDCTSLPATEMCCGRQLSPYAVGKRTAELIAECAFAVHGLSSVGLRYFNVFGPRQRPDSPYAAVIPIFVALLRNGKAPTIYGDGSQTRDFVHAHDVVRANLLSGIAPDIEFAVVNVGTGAATSVTELADFICTQLSATLRPQYAAARPGDIAHSFASTQRAEELLGFVASIELRAALAQLLDR